MSDAKSFKSPDDLVHAQLTKLSTLPDADIHPAGARGLGPITDGYTVLGHYANPPKLGEHFVLNRYESNGVKVPGVYSTSPVMLISREDHGSIGFKTMNSIYRLTPLP